jgi:hypothetical protein
MENPERIELRSVIQNPWISAAEQVKSGQPAVARTSVNSNPPQNLSEGACCYYFSVSVGG